MVNKEDRVLAPFGEKGRAVPVDYTISYDHYTEVIKRVQPPYILLNLKSCYEQLHHPVYHPVI